MRKNSAEAPGVDARFRVLVVEDDDLDAELIVRMLKAGQGSAHFAAERAVDVKQALAHLQTEDVHALLLDLGLPDATRLSGLERLLAGHPTLPIVVITGDGENIQGIEAVRAGAQDYLVKDQITSAALDRSLRYSIERVRALRTEKQLLEETLAGTIKALTTVLAIVNPAAFGRAQRLKELVAGPARILGMNRQWIIEVAAMVSQIGWVQHSPEDCEKHYASKDAPEERRRLVQDMPAVAAEILDGIPHLESVRQILSLQAWRSRRSERSEPPKVAADVMIGAELLFLATQFDILETQVGTKAAALELLRARRDEFDEPVFRAFAGAQQLAISSLTVSMITTKDLVVGMVLADDVLTPDGRLIVARGHEVTPSLLARLTYFGERARVAGPFRVQYCTRPLLAPPAA